MGTSVFISWSGAAAKEFGGFFAEWLKLALGNVQTFYSADIEKGSRWSDQIMHQLALCHFGIIIITSENLHSEWIHFEAGALSQAMNRTGAAAAVTPLLIDVEPYQLPSTLAQFQATRCSRSDLKGLLTTIRDFGQSDIAPTDEIIALQLEAHWPRFEQALSVARLALAESSPENNDKSKVSDSDLLSEIRAEVGNLRQLNEFIVRTLASDSHSTTRGLSVRGATSESTLDDLLAPIATYQFSTEEDAARFGSWLIENHPAIDFEYAQEGMAVCCVNYDEVSRYDRLLVRDTARVEFGGDID